jgi:hypothetical protein
MDATPSDSCSQGVRKSLRLAGLGALMMRAAGLIDVP